MRRIQSICALNPPHGRDDLAPLARQNHPPSATLLPRMGIYCKSGFFPILYNSYWDFQTILCRHIGIYRHDLHTNFGTLAFNNLWEIVILKKCDDFTPVDSMCFKADQWVKIYKSSDSWQGKCNDYAAYGLVVFWVSFWDRLKPTAFSFNQRIHNRSQKDAQNTTRP